MEIVKQLEVDVIDWLIIEFILLDYSHRKRMHPDELSKKMKDKEINEQKQRSEIQRKKMISE